MSDYTQHEYNVDSYPANKHILKAIGGARGHLLCRIQYACRLRDRVCRMGITRLGDEIGYDRSTVSRSAKWLLDEGYIKKIKDVDIENQAPPHYQLTDKFFDLLPKDYDTPVAERNTPVAERNTPVAERNTPVAERNREQETKQDFRTTSDDDDFLNDDDDFFVNLKTLGLNRNKRTKNLNHNLVAIWAANVEYIPTEWGTGLIIKKIEDGEAPPELERWPEPLLLHNEPDIEPKLSDAEKIWVEIQERLPDNYNFQGSKATDFTGDVLTIAPGGERNLFFLKKEIVRDRILREAVEIIGREIELIYS